MRKFLRLFLCAAFLLTPYLAHPVKADSNDVLCLHCDGANNGIDFPDNRTPKKTITPFAGGGARTSTSAYKFGNASAFFDGATDYLYHFWNLGTWDYTIDFRMRSNQTGTYPTLVAKYDDNFGVFLSNGKIFVYHVGGTNLLSTSTYNDNEWHHVAVVRDNGTVTIYKDGNADGTKLMNQNLTTTAFVYVGKDLNNKQYAGFLDEVRVSRKIARWSANFTPPTSEYAPDEWTVMLLHGNGEDNASLIYNAEDQQILNSGVKTNTTFKVLGNASLYFAGAIAYSLEAVHNDWDFGTGNYTAEFQINTVKVPSNYDTILAIDDDEWGIFLNQTGKIMLFQAPGTRIFSNFSVNDGNWHHVAVSRLSGVAKIFIDGNITGNGSATDDISSDYNFQIGHDRMGNGDYNGSLDEIRVSKGVARYTAQFTPPTQMFDCIGAVPVVIDEGQAMFF